MKTVAVIAEYNPFHNGHAYQIEQARALTGADHVIVLMSGNFVQRGTPAIMDKYLRTEMALAGGADFVFELPVLIATASAKDYAFGAVRILSDMHSIDTLCFGAEDADLNLLQSAADFFANETEPFKACLKEFLKNGISYPRARQLVFEKLTGKKGEFLSRPNNILAISYLQALSHFQNGITPLVIQRIGDYHERKLTGSFTSATAIRHVLEKAQDPQEIREFVPDTVFPFYERELGVSYPVNPEIIWPMLQYKLTLEKDSLNEWYDIPLDLSNRLVKALPLADGFEELCSRLVTPSYTRSRIRRCLIHVFLNLKNSDMDQLASDRGRRYVRLLGFRKNHEGFLKYLKDHSELTVLHKAFPEELSGEDHWNACRCSYAYDTAAAELYSMIQRRQYKNAKYIHEYSKKLIKFD